MEKLLLIDGHSILNRAFYGMPMLTSKEGIPTNAILGFLNIMFKNIDEEKPSYLAVAFDLPAPTFRHKMYEAYKGTRKPMDEALRVQVPLIKDMLSAMDIPLMMKEGYEADDLIGTAAGIGEKNGLLVTVLSGDRDLLQLATDKTLIKIPKTKGGGNVTENYHAKDVVLSYGVTPSEFIEVKALQGDSSDNIPGLPGVGPKTATALVQQYHTVEEIIAHADEVKPPKAQAALKENIDTLRLCRRLVEIDTRVEFDFDLDKAGFGNPYTHKAYELCKEYGFKSLLSRFDTSRFDESLIDPEDAGPGAEKDFFEAVEGIDAKIAVIDGLTGEISLRLSEDVLEVLSGGKGYRIAFDTAIERGMALSALEKRMGSSEVDKVYITSLKELLPSVYIPVEKAEDVSLMAYVLDSSRGGYDERDPFTEGPQLARELEEKGAMALYRDVELPLSYVLFDMEREGIALDKTELYRYGEALSKRIGELEAVIYEGAGETFNINSPKQLGVILFEKMQLPGGKKTKTGFSTSADVLEKLAPDVPFVRDVLEYRQLFKLKSTYADGLGAVVASDGRIHCHYQQMVAATGRLSCTEPNLQNIPIRMELGRQIRKLFYPREGCVFIDADYSQIELRILAHLSGDKILQGAFRDGRDVHRDTASKVFAVEYEKVSNIQRRQAKVVNFGIIYGMSSFGLSEDLHISRREAAEFTEAYFATYPGIKAYLDSLIETAKNKGYVTSLFGRRRYIPDINSSNFARRSFSERVAMNSPIQGTAADIMKIAMVRVHDRLCREGLESKILVQVHDELLLEVPLGERERARQILVEEMMGAAELAVPLEVDVHEGATWYEAK